MREAIMYEKRQGDVCQCGVCPHRCEVAPGASGDCKVRENFGGVLFANAYAETTRIEARPIEWIPLYHFMPGVEVLTVGSVGETFPVEFAPPNRPSGAEVDATRFSSTGEICDVALGRSLPALAAFGGEPFAWLEFFEELLARAETAGLARIASTNGYAEPEAVQRVASRLNAVNLITLGTPAAYQRHGLSIDPVIATAKALREAGCHLEVTWLLTPFEGESLLAEADAFVESTNQGLACSAVHLQSPLVPGFAAPVPAVQAVYDRLADRLPAVYLSPIYARGDQKTVCARCGATLVDRSDRGVACGLNEQGHCRGCGAASPVVMSV
jgi:pyruvate formate lyase activating enzyme